MRQAGSQKPILSCEKPGCFIGDVSNMKKKQDCSLVEVQVKGFHGNILGMMT